MGEVIWRTPVPSTAFLREPDLEIRPGRQAVIKFEFETECNAISVCTLVFSNVVHYRITYLFALGVDMFDCYDRILDMNPSEIISEIAPNISDKVRQQDFKHYRFLFDDGPCFDFIASDFSFSFSQ